MKLLPTILLFSLLTSACSKENVKPVYSKGTLVQLHNIKIPGTVEPLTIDSVFLMTNKYNSYYVHDMNNVQYKNLADYQFQLYKR